MTTGTKLNQRKKKLSEKLCRLVVIEGTIWSSGNWQKKGLRCCWRLGARRAAGSIRN